MNLPRIRLLVVAGVDCDMIAECMRRHFSTCLTLRREIHRSSRNHYDILNLTPKASSQDIKQAYYKLSLLYHPDKPKGDGVKFREITAAYEVLGNRKLRRLYDTGLLGGSTSAQPQYRETGFDLKTEDLERFRHGLHRSDERSTRSVDTTYYDTWMGEHYTRTIKRDSKRKAMFEKDLSVRSQADQRGQFQVFLLLFAVGLAILYLLSKDNPYDKTEKPRKS